jgi:hypothetical protein
LDLRQIIFFAVQAVTCLYAFRRGALPERSVAGMMAVAALATVASPVRPHISYYTVELPVLTIDLVFLGCLCILAARADRFWPMWVAALQLLAITVHGVRLYDTQLLPSVYSAAVGLMAYPMMALLVVGTRRHVKRVAARGPEPDWSVLRWR